MIDEVSGDEEDHSACVCVGVRARGCVCVCNTESKRNYFISAGQDIYQWISQSTGAQHLSKPLYFGVNLPFLRWGGDRDQIPAILSGAELKGWRLRISGC